MTHGITTVSVIPLRKEPSHRSEQVSQLLFGETYEVLEKKGNKWIRVRCTYDTYEGWMDEASFHPITEKEFSQLSDSQAAVALDVVSTATGDKQGIPILCGSNLPFFDGMNFRLHKEKFIYNGQAIQEGQQQISMLEKIAFRFLNAPYLWGGRSPFGIDCSGLTQVVFKCLFIPLLRDAWQQAEQGVVVNFVDETQPGDLAFFVNEDDRITHVGIILKEGQIIHASGKVRIDRIDHFGIFHVERKKYSHKLKIIKRVM